MFGVLSDILVPDVHTPGRSFYAHPESDYVRNVLKLSPAQVAALKKKRVTPVERESTRLPPRGAPPWVKSTYRPTASTKHTKLTKHAKSKSKTSRRVRSLLTTKRCARDSKGTRKVGSKRVTVCCPPGKFRPRAKRRKCLVTRRRLVK